MSSGYDPFARGPFTVGVRTIEARDTSRRRTFPCEIWYPAAASHAGQDVSPATQDFFPFPPDETPRSQMAVRDAAAQLGTFPLIVFSHGSARGARRMATYLCTHLSSHGYVVAALDHSEVAAPDLARQASETEEQKRARVDAWIASRVPDIRFLLNHLLDGPGWDSEAHLDRTQVGVVGFSFGGWTVLAAPDVEPRIRAVVALAPGGSSQPKPGILPATLAFAWNRDVPTLFLVAEHDVMLPLGGMYELFDRTPATKLMVILRRADHVHFLDNVEQEHEMVRALPFTDQLAWIPKEMRPIAEHCSGEHAHVFVRGLTLSHMDATLQGREEARRCLLGDLEAELAARGVAVMVHKP
jgi:predicted dienelactone hydrolase